MCICITCVEWFWVLVSQQQKCGFVFLKGSEIFFVNNSENDTYY